MRTRSTDETFSACLALVEFLLCPIGRPCAIHVCPVLTSSRLFAQKTRVYVWDNVYVWGYCCRHSFFALFTPFGVVLALVKFEPSVPRLCVLT